ncbi:hypothetical protein GGR54DRAFT_606955 [Hypoxylon sp. NC1633]|nr:hypothetical protein GGR54DRAFT_606955 [Hypoxylon sp. NC1633]
MPGVIGDIPTRCGTVGNRSYQKREILKFHHSPSESNMNKLLGLAFNFAMRLDFVGQRIDLTNLPIVVSSRFRVCKSLDEHAILTDTKHLAAKLKYVFLLRSAYSVTRQTYIPGMIVHEDSDA